jgi:GxxExxY protein
MMKNKKNYKDDLLTKKIIGACYEVHNKLGPGFVEKIYLNALKSALTNSGLDYQVEKEFWVSFDDRKVGKFRADLVIENKVIVELKATEGRLSKIFESQVISYLKASGLKAGLLVNFGNRRCQIRRLMLTHISDRDCVSP